MAKATFTQVTRRDKGLPLKEGAATLIGLPSSPRNVLFVVAIVGEGSFDTGERFLSYEYVFDATIHLSHCA